MPLTCLAPAITGTRLRSNLSPVAQEEHQELPLLTLRSIDFHELWGDGGFASCWRTWSRRRVRLTEHDLWRSAHATGRTHCTLTNKIQWWVWVTRGVKWNLSSQSCVSNPSAWCSSFTGSLPVMLSSIQGPWVQNINGSGSNDCISMDLGIPVIIAIPFLFAHVHSIFQFWEPLCWFLWNPILLPEGLKKEAE